MSCPPIRAFDFLFKDKKDLVGAEIGVLAGSHALKMLQRLDFKTFYLIDPYFKYKAGGLKWDNERHEKTAKEKLQAYEEKMIWIKTTSVKAVVHFEDESLDFVYIDANHDYKFTLEDIKLWAPKVKQGGIVGGHDYVPAHPGVAKAVKEYCSKNKIEYKIKYFVNKKVNVDWAFKKGGELIKDWDIPEGNVPNEVPFKPL